MAATRHRPGYDARGLMPDAGRLADARHVKRDADTGEISWPPSRITDVLRELKLINEKDHDT